MDLPENTLKQALVAGKVQYGLWLNSGSALFAELAGQVGFDWCLIDGEHGPNTLTEILPQLQALRATGTPAVVRIPEARRWMVKQVLDQGAQTVVIPMVHTAELAADMARAMRYPPEGVRGMGASLARASGFGGITDYVHRANDQMFCFVQAESAEAVSNIDAIAATNGVDGVFIGPADLSADMGFPGEPDHPEVIAAIDHLIGRIQAAGKAVGIFTSGPAQALAYAEKGVTFISVGGDTSTLRVALDGLVQKLQAK